MGERRAEGEAKRHLSAVHHSTEKALSPVRTVSTVLRVPRDYRTATRSFPTGLCASILSPGALDDRPVVRARARSRPP